MALDFSGFLGVHPIGRFVWKSGTGNEINLVLDEPFGGQTVGYLLRENMLKGMQGRGKQWVA